MRAQRSFRFSEADRCRRAECRTCRGWLGQGCSGFLLFVWPYGIRSFVDVAPPLASQGYRVIVPCLLGYTARRFLSNATVRNDQQSVVAVDILRPHEGAENPNGNLWRF